MTAAAPARPARPPRSLALPLGLVAFALVTAAALSEPLGIGVDPAELAANATRGRRILAELLAPNWSFLPRTAEPMLETLRMAVVASAIGCATALPAAFLASRVTAPGATTLRVARWVLSVLRSIPDVLYALIFVAALGIGPLPGVLALVVFNVGVVAKLLSESVDAVDAGPIEASTASGGTRLQTVRWAVLPQVLPHYVAYSLYALELNVRASTVLGIVGAGGIGRLLFAEYGYFRWSNVAVIVAELFVVVLAIELASMALRRRLV